MVQIVMGEDDMFYQATAYELCKLQNVTDSDINDQGMVKLDKLMPDCQKENVKMLENF